MFAFGTILVWVWARLRVGDATRIFAAHVIAALYVGIGDSVSARRTAPDCADQENREGANRRKGHMNPKNTIRLRFDTDADQAARFYVETFPDSALTAVLTVVADRSPRRKS